MEVLLSQMLDWTSSCLLPLTSIEIRESIPWGKLCYDFRHVAANLTCQKVSFVSPKHRELWDPR